VAGLAAIGYALFGHRAAPPAAGSPRSASHLASPARTVQAYFGAINASNYAKAWRLRGDPGNTKAFRQFVAGFSGTANDKINIIAVRGDVVTAQLIARQTDGSVKFFSGTYTVSNGVIVTTNVHPVTPPPAT
jgi:eukaryotic-like serine/threonine-protein kinase